MAEENNKKEKISVKIDTERTELLARENERLKIEKERREDPESDLAEKKLQAIQKFGKPELWMQATSKDMLSSMLTNYISELAERANPTQKPSGTARCDTPQQMGLKPEDLYTRKFYDSQQMVSELRRLSKEGTPQEKADSEHYLNELWKKYVLDKRSQPTRAEPNLNPNAPEELLSLGLKQKDGFLTPANPEDGDLGQLQRKWRLERKRRMENQHE